MNRKVENLEKKKKKKKLAAERSIIREREPLWATTSIICQPYCRRLIAQRRPNACYRDVIEDGWLIARFTSSWKAARSFFPN